MNAEVQNYIDAVPEGKPLFDQLQGLILSLYPDAEVAISEQIPTYKVRGRKIGLGYWKRGVSLYLARQHDVDEFEDEHQAADSGVDCINFKVSDVVPMPVLKQVIRNAIEHGADIPALARMSRIRLTTEGVSP